MWNLFIKNMKGLLHSKTLIFWMLLFPIILSTLFFFAFDKLDEGKVFSKVKIAVVYEEENAAFRGALTVASEELFTVTETDAADAEKLLNDEQVTAVILVGSTIRMQIKSVSQLNADILNQSMVKMFLDRFGAVSGSIMNIMMNGGGDLDKIYADLMNETSVFYENSTVSANNSSTVIYYYALLGMTCFYFAMAGQSVVSTTQPNQSTQAQRVNVSATSRVKIFLAMLAANFAVLIVILAVIMIWIIFVLGISFGNRIGLVLLASLIGTLVGVGFGLVVGVLIPKKEGVKIAVNILVTMILSVLAGLVSPQLKHSVNSVVPWLRYVNPVGLISDCFYSLYYYTSLQSFALYAGILCGYIVLFYGVAILCIRRKKYASI